MDSTVSIIVPTRNGGIQFEELLDRLSSQKSAYRPELVVIDSGSSDDTVKHARRHGAKVIAIDPATFNHGDTRNLGIRESGGEICILLVQDALPISESWLDAMVEHFGRDPLICGVTTGQVPRPDADLVVRWEVLSHNERLGEQLEIRSIPEQSEFARLPMYERFFLCNFDNVCSAVRRSAWEVHPFRRLPFAEDLDWGVRALQSGYKIVYEPRARVVHSHLRPAIYHLRRQYVSAKVIPEILRCTPSEAVATNDQEWFSYINGVIDESLSLVLLVNQLKTDIDVRIWHQQVRDLEVERPHPLGSAVISEQPSSDPVRAHFFYLLSEVTRIAGRLSPTVLKHLIIHCAARSIGGFLGGYYSWSEQRGRVSSSLRELDGVLSAGV